jgi:hypothetical protein
MNLYRVPILRDEPSQRGSMIYSVTAGTLAFLDKEGKLHHFDSAQTFAILCLFDDLHKLAAGQLDNVPLVRWIAVTERIKGIFVNPPLDFRRKV